jgi:hypothetical protein
MAPGVGVAAIGLSTSATGWSLTDIDGTEIQYANSYFFGEALFVGSRMMWPTAVFDAGTV